MATQTRKIQTLVVSLETKPGALAHIYGAFREENVNVLASWGYEMGPGQAQAVLYPEDFTKAKKVLTQLGLKPTESYACYATGDDKVGAYAELLHKISKAGINLHATDAFSINGKWATVFFAEEKDLPTLCNALGC